MSEKIKSFLSEDDKRLEILLDKYPFKIPIQAISDFLHIDAQSVRAYLEAGNGFGMSWKKIGKDNHAYAIPSAQFTRWYLNLR